MGEYTIRRATLDDVEDMVRLRHDMQAEMGEVQHGVDADAIVDANREYFTKQLNGFHFTGFLAEHEGQIVGTGAFVVYDTPPSRANPSGTDAYVLNMYTVPEHRGHGIARDILAALIDRAYEEGARRIWLRTSEQARRMYEHLGFESRSNYMQKYLD
jgi:GNAT superfamily N-acetyltransferase